VFVIEIALNSSGKSKSNAGFWGSHWARGVLGSTNHILRIWRALSLGVIGLQGWNHLHVLTRLERTMWHGLRSARSSTDDTYTFVIDARGLWFGPTKRHDGANHQLAGIIIVCHRVGRRRESIPSALCLDIYIYTYICENIPSAQLHQTFLARLYVSFSSLESIQEKVMGDDWEYYKDILRQHFLTDKTLKETMEFMENTYNFRARYALVLRLWRLRTAKFS
jgi:hypothetical protein